MFEDVSMGFLARSDYAYNVLSSPTASGKDIFKLKRETGEAFLTTRLSEVLEERNDTMPVTVFCHGSYRVYFYPVTVGELRLKADAWRVEHEAEKAARHGARAAEREANEISREAEKIARRLVAERKIKAAK